MLMQTHTILPFGLNPDTRIQSVGTDSSASAGASWTRPACPLFFRVLLRRSRRL